MTTFEMLEEVMAHYVATEKNLATAYACFAGHAKAMLTEEQARQMLASVQKK